MPKITVEELWSILKGSPERIEKLMFNGGLTEEMALLIAENRNSPPEYLAILATSPRFKDSYRVKLALSKNPRTPHRITLSLLKFLRLFDLADLSRNQNIPVNIRQKVEEILIEKIPSLPLGNRITLGKRSSPSIVMAILSRMGGESKGSQTTITNLINTCLENPLLKEGDILKLINNPSTPSSVIQAISVHPRWSARYSIRYALIRNFHTPLRIVVEFLREMKVQDLEELYRDEAVPSSTRPFIYREIMTRTVTSPLR